MNKNKKIVFFLSAIFATVCVLAVGKASANYNWKDYFSFGQIKAITNKTKGSILNKINTDSDWKKAILKVTDDAYLKQGDFSSAADNHSFVKNLSVGGLSTDNRYGLLNVNTGADIAGISLNYQDLVAGWRIGRVGSNGSFNIGTASGTSSNSMTDSKLTIDTNGNVGIGTTTPQTKLEVSGTTRITGDTIIGGTSTDLSIDTNESLPTDATLVVNGNILTKTVVANEVAPNSVYFPDATRQITAAPDWSSPTIVTASATPGQTITTDTAPTVYKLCTLSANGVGSGDAWGCVITRNSDSTWSIQATKGTGSGGSTSCSMMCFN